MAITIPNAQGTDLCLDAFVHILSFLPLKQHGPLESVCTLWKTIIDEYWQNQCQIQLGISSKTDPKAYLPCNTYKESFWLISPSILGAVVYRRYVGETSLISPIPKDAFKRWSEKDPCDEMTTIGKEYVWMYCPSYIEIDQEGFSLNKPDNPEDPIAPCLIRNSNIDAQSENKTLKVPVTLYNVAMLFAYSKTSAPTGYFFNPAILDKHGSTRVSAEWICMRKNVIGKNLTFHDQLKFCQEKKVIIVSLIHRMLFNFLEHARSNVYPDGKVSTTWTRTSTLIYDNDNRYKSTYCGVAGNSVSAHAGSLHYRGEETAVGVRLPSNEFQNTDPVVTTLNLPSFKESKNFT